MPIHSHAGDIFKTDLQMLMVWLCSGFTSIHATWAEFCGTHKVGVVPAGPCLADEPWKNRDTLLAIASEGRGSVRWIYALNTNQDSLGYPTLDEVSAAIYRALETARNLHLRVIGMTHVRYSPGGLTASPQDQEESASAMVEATKQWLCHDGDPNIDVVFCDLRGAFEQLAPPWPVGPPRL